MDYTILINFGILYGISLVIYLTLIYIVLREIRVSNIVVSLTPVLNVLAVIITLFSSSIMLYKKYEDKVIIGNKKIPKPKKK